jgi:putative sigma-54 modulation protein
MYASIDAAAERIERQLKKHKEKLTTRKNGHGHAHTAGPLPPPMDIRHDVLDVIDHPDRPSHRVVKSKRFEARPMNVDEAILQMELLDSTFFVFLDEGDRALNVVYKRDDGTLGLLEARAGVARNGHAS